METKQDLYVLIRINGKKWARKRLELDPESKSFDILNADTFCLEWRIGRESLLSVKNEKNLYLRACPKSPKGDRIYHKYEMEFERPEDQEHFNAFLTDTNMVIRGQRKRLLVFVNPVSGRGRAKKIWEDVTKMLEEAEIDFETVITKRAGQAKETVETMDLDKYDGVVSVSGDGGLHEIINGLFRRTEAMDSIRIGHGVHNSILHYMGEKFSSEIPFSALSLARQVDFRQDILECETKSRRFVSMFGVAWGIIPEVDLDSEIFRFIGSSRGWLMAAWKWLRPRFQPGIIHYLPHDPDTDPDDIQLPDLSEPVPDNWVTVQGPFYNVYACKQSWLDYSLLFCPDQKPDDGRVWLVIMNDNWSHYWGAYWMLQADRASHIECPGTQMVAVSAFRFCPQRGEEAVMTVDAERLQEGAVQGVVRRSKINLMVNREL